MLKGVYVVLSYSGNMFLFHCAFEHRHLAKDAGFSWSPPLRKWYTQYYSIAIQLKKYADEKALEIFAKSEIQITSEAPETKWPTHLKPKDYQLEGVKFATTRNRCLLRHDPGTGKTIEAVLCMNAIPGRVLIVCPPFLKINWMREINTWAVPKRSVTIVESGKDKAYNWGSDVIIIPDSLAANTHIQKSLKGQKFEWLFIDEVQRFKTHDSQRTLAVIGGQKGAHRYNGVITLANRIVALSGTPMPARPIELFPLLNSLAPQVIDFRSRHQYGERFCGAYHDGYGWVYTGASNQDELKKRLSKDFMHVVHKKDVLKDLPDKIYEPIYLDPSKLSKSFTEQDEGIQTLLLDSTVDDLISGALGKMAAYRKDLGDAKVDQAVDFIKSLLENTDESILVFGWHKTVLKKLESELEKYKPFLINGDTNNKIRMKYVDEFQKNSERRLFLGNIQAMGVGLTLTKATRVVFIEYSWTPSDNEQAEDRTHRIGQTKSVVVHYLIVADTIDEKVLESIQAKQHNIKRIVG